MNRYRIHKPSEPVSAQFVALLAILVLAPLPLAGNRPWAVALLGSLIAILFLWHLWFPEKLRIPAEGVLPQEPPWRRALLPLALLGAWVVLLALHLVPLPAGWVAALYRNAHDGFPVIDGDWIPLSVDPHSTRLYLLKALVLFAFFWLTLRLANTPARVELLAKTIVVCGGLQAAIGVILFAVGARYSLFFVQIDHGIAHGTFVNRNHFAGYLEMTLAVGIGLMIAKLEETRTRSWRQWITDWLGVIISEKARLRIMLIVMVVGLIASRSRMGNAAFFFSLLIAGGIAIALSKHATRAAVVFIASLLVIDIVIIGGAVGVEKVLERIENTNLRAQPDAAAIQAEGGSREGGLEARTRVAGAGQREESVEERTAAGRRAAAVIYHDFPVFGTGGGTFAVTFMPYQPAELRGYFDHAHNDYAEFAIETGIVGVTLLGALLVASLYHAVRILVVRRNRLARGMAFASLMGIVALMIHSVVDFNLQIPANAMIFMVILAMPFLVGSRGAPEAGTKRGPTMELKNENC